VAFKSTLNSVPGVPTSLAIKASGDTRFSGAVGKIGPLASLSTNAGTGQPSAGTTFIDGGLVATIGDGGQSYSDKLILGADTTFTSGPKGAIVFNDTLDGAAKATLSAGGALIFFQKVGGTTPLRGLSITNASSTYAAKSVVLDGRNNAAADDGLVLGAGVNAVTIGAAGTSFTGFRGNGIVLAGGSTNSLLSGLDVKNNGASGISIGPGSYTGTVLQGMTISGNKNGLWLDAAQAINIKTNRVISNTAFGLYAKGSSTGTTVTGNSISGNGTNIDTKAATGGTFQTS
jgi:parallel beta-helix repeat protein